MLLAVLLLQYKYLALLESPYKTTHFPWPPQKVAVLCKPLPYSQYIPRSLSPWCICWMSAKKTLKIKGTCFWFTTPSYCCILINSEFKKRTHLALHMSNREEFSADDSMYSLHPHREQATGGKLAWAQEQMNTNLPLLNLGRRQCTTAPSKQWGPKTVYSRNTVTTSFQPWIVSK